MRYLCKFKFDERKTIGIILEVLYGIVMAITRKKKRAIHICFCSIGNVKPDNSKKVRDLCKTKFPISLEGDSAVRYIGLCVELVTSIG